MTSPYTPPNTPLIKELPPTDSTAQATPQLLPEPRSCDAANGINWLSQAFTMFKVNWLLWIGMAVVFLVIIAAASALPIIGILINVMIFVFIGGIVKGCAVQAEGGDLRFEHLFAAFKTHLVPLCILGLLYLLGMIIAMVPLMLVVGGMVVSMLMGDVAAVSQGMATMSIIGIIFAYLISFALMIPLLMAIWFSPALIVLHDIEPILAMKKSFKACLANILPMFVYGLVVMIVMPIVIIFTLGLGMLVVMPVLMLTYYTSYRDVWSSQPLSAGLK